MNYSVYKHTFPNGKVYIGITRQKPERRWRNGEGYTHKYKNGKYRQPLIAKAILKYNWNDIRHEILYDNLSREEAENFEIELIDKYQSNNIEFGYNSANGGNTTGTVSDETKEKIRRANLGKQMPEETKKKISKSSMGKKRSEESIRKTAEAHIGMTHSKEAKKKMSDAAKGRVFSEETKKKMSESKSGERCVWYGKHHSEESKIKISKANSKQVRCIETNKIYDSMIFAENETGVNRSKISLVCNGKRKTTGGYHWEFVYEDIGK